MRRDDDVPDSALHLRAQNLQVFLQLAHGVDDATWSHHPREADYARWFRDSIKSKPLAAEVEQIQHRFGDDPVEGRARLRQAVQHGYATPAYRALQEVDSRSARAARKVRCAAVGASEAARR
jgi:hypothetical protein